MKKIVFLSVFLIAGSAFAAGTMGALKLIEREAKVQNGGAHVSTYNVRGFNLEKRVATARKEARDAARGTDCRYEVFSSRRRAIEFIGSDGWIEDRKVAAVLRRLYNEGQIRAIVSMVWDGVSGDSEYCSQHFFDIYTVDGNYLSLEYSTTT